MTYFKTLLTLGHALTSFASTLCHNFSCEILVRLSPMARLNGEGTHFAAAQLG